ncbi:hypothetical protein MC885_018600 [Smutsia gigantea]|nr:hypothetical protein MC885_018600 [Smutsia gigantea]
MKKQHTKCFRKVAKELRGHIVAAILAIAGIVMMTYADGFHSHSVIGIALAVGSASMSALYKVLFKLLLGSAKFGEAALFLSVLGVFNILFVTCIPVILYFTKVEYWSSFDDIPWGNLCGFSVLLLKSPTSPLTSLYKTLLLPAIGELAAQGRESLTLFSMALMCLKA